MQNYLKSARYWLFLGLVGLAPMSFSPSIALPVLNFPSFRIGLYQLLAILFVVACTTLVNRKAVSELSHKRLFLVGAGLLVLTLIIGLVTTSVLGRTMLYSASLVALFTLGLAGYFTWKELTVAQKTTVSTILLWSGVVFGGLAIGQLVLASFDRDALGTLCTGCSDAVFGFPRINLFAAEPQFFANSLLPALFAGIFIRQNTRLANWSLLLTSIAIGLTFSRGAFVAVAVACGAYLVVQFVRKQRVRQFLLACCAIAGSIVLSFAMLVASASVRYHDTPHIAFNTAVSMLDHLSMGTITIPQRSAPAPETSTVSTNEPDEFTPEGFVEASSNDRLGAARLALDAWNDSPKTILFGVGMGNLGTYVNEHIQGAPSNLTVYIWYVLVLAELGLTGLAAVLIAPVYILWRLLRSPDWPPLTGAVFAITIAFCLQLFFFGSYINVMYLYLFMGMFAAHASLLPALRQR